MPNCEHMDEKAHRIETKKIIKSTKDSIKSILQPYGFKGPRGQYHLDIGTGVLMIGYCGSSYGGENFTLNVGFGVHELYKQLDEPQQATSYRVYNCHYVNRIGWFNKYLAPAPIKERIGKKTYRTRDIWWTIDSKSSSAHTANKLNEISNLLTNVVLPFTMEWADINKFLDHLKSTDDFIWLYDRLQSSENLSTPPIRIVG